MEPSPMLQMTIPGFWLTRLKSAAPVEIGALPPTIALFGKIPNGIKNACIDPPSPRLKPVWRPPRLPRSCHTAGITCHIFDFFILRVFLDYRERFAVKEVFHNLHKLLVRGFSMQDIPLRGSRRGSVGTKEKSSIPSSNAWPT